MTIKMTLQTSLVPGTKEVEQDGKLYEITVREIPNTPKHILSPEERKILWEMYYRLHSYDDPINKHIEGPVNIRFHLSVNSCGDIYFQVNWSAYIFFAFSEPDFFSPDILNSALTKGVGRSLTKADGAQKLLDDLPEYQDLRRTVELANDMMKTINSIQGMKRFMGNLYLYMVNRDKSQLVNLIGEEE